MQLIECVPNVSEGRNPTNVAKMAKCIQNTARVKLLHMDTNKDANRTVFTFVGPVADVVDAAVSLTGTATALIDMRVQSGEHVRNGAVDVCPLIPVKNVSLETCVEAAKLLGSRLGALGIPIYLYAAAASSPKREQLSWLRKGQYEALAQKLGCAEWAPDFGPNEWSESVARTGSTQVGARPLLIAFNVNLATRDVRIARKIARIIRTSGYRGVPGEFTHLKADGWWMENYQCAQITMNFTNYKETPLHKVYTRIQKLAREQGTTVTGSELIGLLPEEALIDAGASTIPSSPSVPSVNEDELIRAGVDFLGLNAITPFDKSERILERRIAAK